MSGRNKGSISDVPAIMAVLFGTGVTLLVVFKIYNSINQFQLFSSSAAFQSVGTALSVLDYTAAFGTVGFMLGSFYFASRVRTSKIFLPVSIFLMIISVWISSIFSNTFAVLLANSGFSSVSSSVPVTKQVLTNLPLFMLVAGSLINVALYSRIGVGTGGGRRARR